MSTYHITNPTTGADLGKYDGDTAAEALNEMALDAGYSDYAACCADVPAPDGGLRVVECGPEDETEQEAGRRIDEERNDRAGREINALAKLQAAGIDPATCGEEEAAAVVGPAMAVTLCRQSRRLAALGYVAD